MGSQFISLIIYFKNILVEKCFNSLVCAGRDAMSAVVSLMRPDRHLPVVSTFLK